VARQKNEAYNLHLKALILQVMDNQITGGDMTGQSIETVIAEALMKLRPQKNFMSPSFTPFWSRKTPSSGI